MERGEAGKVAGRIDKMKHELEDNSRLDFVFSLCEDLKIDDPVAWMNSTKPVVVDWWIAYRILKNERQNAAEDSSEEMSGEEASAHLHNLMK